MRWYLQNLILQVTLIRKAAAIKQQYNFDPVFEFNQADYSQQLHLSDGTLYVEASTIGKISAALKSGYAVYGEGCNGRDQI